MFSFAGGSDSTKSQSTKLRPDAAANEISDLSMRRIATTGAGLFSLGAALGDSHDEKGAASTASMRRNTSEASLSEMRRREQSVAQLTSPGSCAAVVESMATLLLEHILGKDEGFKAMQEDLKCQEAHRHGKVIEASAGVDFGIARSLQDYILTIVKHLELPNSCTVASLIYVQRAINTSRFSLSLNNWQPCLLAAFVISSKLSFDEPVWNEDFVKALRISNVQVAQVSRWEADFLQLLSFNTNVNVEQYASMCFELQQVHVRLHKKHCHFFTYLMSLSEDPSTQASVGP